jgi:hypothetical protein
MGCIFLMCSERSGSNLITKVLNAHPEICGPSPKHIFNPVVTNTFRYGDLRVDSNWAELLQDIERLMSINFSVWTTKFDVNFLNALSPDRNVAKLLGMIFQTEAQAHNKEHVLIKENRVYEFLPFLQQNFQDAMFLYQVRDPRDMALSWRKYVPATGGVVAGAKKWRALQMRTLPDIQLLQKEGRVHSLRYEDLIQDSKRTIKEVCDFLGLKYHEQILDFHQDPLTMKNAEKENAWKNLSKGIIKTNTANYRTDLSDFEIAVVEKICFYEMKYLGYQPVHSLEQLKTVSLQAINELEQQEYNKYRGELTQGIKDNTKAKSYFYNRSP